jgi:hypothetical protein
MTRRCGVLLLALVFAGPALAQAGPQRPTSACTSQPKPDRLAGLSPLGEIELGSGALARLADLRLPEAGSEREAALAWLKALAGRPVAVVAGAPDRWNRLVARITLTDNATTADTATGAQTDLARGLVAAGHALVDLGSQDSLCQPDLLALEAAARGKGLGLWAAGQARPLPAEPGALNERIGSFVLVEGRVRSVGDRGARIYLNFGRAWSQDFTITLPKRTWGILTARGLSAEALTGRRVRARGILEEWNGPALTISGAEMIEILGPEPTAR